MIGEWVGWTAEIFPFCFGFCLYYNQVFISLNFVLLLYFLFVIRMSRCRTLSFGRFVEAAMACKGARGESDVR